MLRIREHTIVENGLAGQPIGEIGSDAGVLRLLEDRAGQRQRSRRFAVIVGTPPPEHRLRSIVIDIRAEPLQQTQAAIATGGIATRSRACTMAVGPVGGGWSRIGRSVVEFLPGGMHQKARLAIPFGTAPESVVLGIRRQFRIAGVGWLERWRPAKCWEVGTGLSPLQNHAPHRLPGVERRVARGDKLTQLRRRHQHLATRMLEENRVDVFFREPIERFVITGDACHYEVRLARFDRQVVTAVDHEDARLLQAIAKGIAGYHGALQNVAPMAGLQRSWRTTFEVRKKRGVFHIEADLLGTGRLEKRWGQRCGLFGIGIGEHQHSVALGCFSHCGCGVVKALGSHPGGSQDPHQIVVFARRDHPSRRRGDGASKPHYHAGQDRHTEQRPPQFQGGGKNCARGSRF